MSDQVKQAAPVSFRKIFKPNRPTFEYYPDSWSYFKDFIDILKRRGAAFITMSEAFQGTYDDRQINVILDHHIDFYPAETEAMCRWELENGVVSSVYLFNYSPYWDRGQPQPWTLEDLDIPFYQKLERAGFEIGYHSNAVGQARLLSNSEQPYYTREIPESILAKAKAIFEYDIKCLREHFDVRTFIPHGGGEGNTQLLDLPDSCSNLIWAYNGRREADVQAPKWRNFSDSNTFYPQRMNGGRATYITAIDNLHVFAHLAEPGLNHVLLHCGRYAGGMPYSELYQGPTPLLSEAYEDTPYVLPNNAETPVRASNFLKDKPEASSEASCDNNTGKEKYYLVCDSLEVLKQHLMQSADVIPTYFFHRRIADEEKAAFKVPRGVDKARFPLPDGSGALLDDCRAFVNLAYAPSVLSHLATLSVPLDVVDIQFVTSNRVLDAELLPKILDRLSPYGFARIEVGVDTEYFDRWLRLAKKVLAGYDDAVAISGEEHAAKERFDGRFLLIVRKSSK